MQEAINNYNNYKKYKEVKACLDNYSRYLDYVAYRTTADGNRHASTVKFDTVSKWSTYVDDYKFNAKRDNVVYYKGYGYPAEYFK